MTEPIIKNLTSAEARVAQMPVSVDLECPLCGHSTTRTYADFRARYGEPPDWNGTVVTCDACGEKFVIDGQDWD